MMVHSGNGSRLRVLCVASSALFGILAAIGASPASAHSSAPVSATPMPDSTVATLPGIVSVTFAEKLEYGMGTIVVLAPSGEKISAGTTIDGATLATVVTDPGLMGVYKVAFQAISVDGSPIESNYTFSVSTGAQGAAEPKVVDDQAVDSSTNSNAEAAGSGSSALTPVFLIGGALALLAIGVTLVLRRRRITTQL